MSVDLSQFHQVFFEESFENLDAMESHLMALDPNHVDEEVINSIFRAAHSIKGGAGTFGFSTVAEFTHLVETLLDEIRSGKRKIQPEEVDSFLQAVDCLREALHCAQRGEPHDQERVDSLSKEFSQLLDGAVDLPVSCEQAAANSGAAVSRRWFIRFKPDPLMLATGNEPIRLFRALAELGDVSVFALVEELPAFESLQPEQCYLAWDIELQGKILRSDIEEVFEWVADEAQLCIEEKQEITTNGETAAWQIDFLPNANIFRSGNDPLRLLRQLHELGSVQTSVSTTKIPDFEHFHPDHCYMSWQIELDSQCESKDIEAVFEWVADEASIEIKKINGPSPSEQSQVVELQAAIDSPKQSQPESGAKSPIKMESSSIRVAIEKIDSLINMVGELVITQSMLGQIGGNFSIEKLPRLLEGLGQLEHNTRELQESVMRIRMLPISFAFSRFPRMVRDLGRKLNKQIELVLRGEQTELDKTVMERIGDPLVHLVRNAIDHGIESPDERKRQGKPATGTILLNAYHQSGNVVIEIQDDGRGINRENLIRKAQAQGLLVNTEISSLSDNQVFDLIFHPGLSTAEQVSDVSGRGVGMDVVKRNIQELNGNIDIKSKTGEGTTITVRLPLTLAILDGQLVRVGNSIYIFPLVSIVESIQVKQDDLNQVADGCEVFQLRNEYIPVIRLYEIFGVKPDTTDISESLLVVVEADGEKIGVVVDELSAQQQVVIKSLEQNYERIEGVSGATILGDGTVSLILDIPGIMKLAGNFHLSTQHLSRRYESRVSQALN